MDGYKKPIIAVAGPTASGKTRLAVALAKEYSAEVVSCDSMQIYKELSISTAKPTKEEMQGVPHHLTDFLPITESFSVADYCDMAKECINEITQRGKNVVLCGGTGLYMQSLLENIDFSGNKADIELRETLQKRVETDGAESVWNELLKIDPETANSLHPNNTGRVIRAIELYYTSGITMSEQKKLSKKNPSDYKSCIICLDYSDRQKLYDRINLRVDMMLSDGLEKEAREFYERIKDFDGTSRQAIGCKEFIPYFEGFATFDDAVEAIKRETRRYAKRQLTWFNRMDGVNKLYADSLSFDEIFEKATEIIEKSGIFGQSEV